MGATGRTGLGDRAAFRIRARGPFGAVCTRPLLFLAEDADGLDASGAVGWKNGGEKADGHEKKSHGHEGERVGGADAEDERGDDAAQGKRCRETHADSE